jgi:hypothetical protein
MTACGAIPTKTFQFQSINVQEVKCPCMIVIDDNWDAAISNKQVFDSTKMEFFSLEIPFAKRSVNVQAVPLPSGGNVPKSRSDMRNNPSRYESEKRDLQLTDPTSQLFVFNIAR